MNILLKSERDEKLRNLVEISLFRIIYTLPTSLIKPVVKIGVSILLLIDKPFSTSEYIEFLHKLPSEKSFEERKNFSSSDQYYNSKMYKVTNRFVGWTFKKNLEAQKGVISGVIPKREWATILIQVNPNSELGEKIGYWLSLLQE